MEWLVFLGEHESWYADILHLHDWQTALCAAYQKTLYQTTSAFKNLRTILTVHNLGYQGLFPGKSFPTTGLPVQYFGPKHLEFYGSVNLLKGGLVFSDALTTVSPTYSREIQTKEFGFGLEGFWKSGKGFCMELSTESMTAYGIRRRIRTFATIIPWRTCLGRPAARAISKRKLACRNKVCRCCL